MNVTFGLEICKNKANDQEVTILIRFTQNRKSKRISTGVKIPIKHWNQSKQKVKSTNNSYIELNGIVNEKLKRAITAYRDLLEEGIEVDLYEIKNKLTKKSVTDFFEFAKRTKIEQIKSSNKLGTLRRYETVLAKFKEFTNGNININKVDYTLLQNFDKYLSIKKNTLNTISSNLSVIRSVINEAIRHGIYTKNNPFSQFHLKHSNNTKEKLSIDELNRIMDTELPPIPSLIMARDFFIACFLSEGTRAGDMLIMKKVNLIDGYLIFNQQKTGKEMSIPITDELQNILSRNKNDSQFIFNYMSKYEKIDEIKINSCITVINKYLKELCKYCRIFKKITTHVARHSYTDFALKVSNNNIYQVQQSLGHSSVRTTELYSRKRLNFEKESLVPDILKLLKDKKQ